MRQGQRIRVVCTDREAGTLCRQWGYTSAGTVALVVVSPAGRETVFIRGEPRPFTLRSCGRYIQRGRRSGPLLEERK